MNGKSRISALDKHAKYDNQFYKLMVEYLGEEVFVTDGTGKIIFVNPASIKCIGMPVDQIIGKNVTELVEEGYFTVSSSLEVLKQRKPVNVIQKLKNGRNALATGIPIFDNSQEEILMVISTCKDVDAINHLLSTVEEQEKKLQEKTGEIMSLREELFVEEHFISGDESTNELKKAIAKIGPLDVTVLVEGETGVGKEVAVRSLHRFSNRKDKPYIKINCGIIPENLIESELFGYEKGAFTGANKEGKMGKVELADGGTLFLDEIGEMPLSMQVKLLDFLQDGTFTRVGGTEKIHVDARIVAATNRNLKEMCAKGLFRQDLYYRLNVIPLRIPPLRERINDIEALSKYFISRYNSKYGGCKQLGEDVQKALCSYDWPGNVRELEHIMERIFIMTDGDVITVDTLNLVLYGYGNEGTGAHIVCTEIMPLKEAKCEIERQLISKACKLYSSTYKVAEALKIDQSTVVKLMQKHRK